MLLGRPTRVVAHARPCRAAICTYRTPRQKQQQKQHVSRSVGLFAKRREVDNVDFRDQYDNIYDVLVQNSSKLPVRELRTLIYNTRQPEQARAVLMLLRRDIENRRAQSMVESILQDWPARKSLYMKLSVRAIEVGAPEVVLAFFQNVKFFELSTYFGKEAIIELGKAGASVDVLMRSLDLWQAARGPEDKGLQHMYYELHLHMQQRGLLEPLVLLHERAKTTGVALSPNLAKAVVLLEAATKQQVPVNV